MRPLIDSLKNIYLFSLSGSNSELDNQSLPDVDVSPSLLKTLSQVRTEEGDLHVCVCRYVWYMHVEGRVQPWIVFFRSHPHVRLWRQGKRTLVTADLL